MHTILIVAADPIHGDLIRHALHTVPGRSYHCLQVGHVRAALMALTHETVDAIVVHEQQESCQELLAAVKVFQMAPPVVVIHSDETSCVENLVRLGAADLLPRFHLSGCALKRCLDHAIEKQHLRRQIHSFRLRLQEARAEMVRLDMELKAERARVRDRAPEHVDSLVHLPEVILERNTQGRLRLPDAPILRPVRTGVSPDPRSSAPNHR